MSTRESTPNGEMQSPQKAIIKSVDMSEAMQAEVVEMAMTALEKYNVERDIAMWLKKEADRLWGTTWHCVVGKNFVTHETKNFIYFYLGPTAVLLWKTS